MPKKNFFDKSEQKQELGRILAACRGRKSLREVAKAIGIPPSNLSYIEKGVNAPSPEIYYKLINELSPNAEIHIRMDELYTVIRNLPPPDVCYILLKNRKLTDVIRQFNDIEASDDLLIRINDLIKSIHLL